jgi:hypothetical protein
LSLVVGGLIDFYKTALSVFVILALLVGVYALLVYGVLLVAAVSKVSQYLRKTLTKLRRLTHRRQQCSSEQLANFVWHVVCEGRKRIYSMFLSEESVKQLRLNETEKIGFEREVVSMSF